MGLLVPFNCDRGDADADDDEVKRWVMCKLTGAGRPWTGGHTPLSPTFVTTAHTQDPHNDEDNAVSSDFLLPFMCYM